MKDRDTELNEIKVVLLALWNDTPHTQAQDIISKFKEEIDEINKGN